MRESAGVLAARADDGCVLVTATDLYTHLASTDYTYERNYHLSANRCHIPMYTYKRTLDNEEVRERPCI